MNGKQRRKYARAQKRHAATHCDRCGMKEAHFIITGPPRQINGLIQESKPRGFYTCPDLYGEDGRRKEMSDLPISFHADAALGIGLSFLALAKSTHVETRNPGPFHSEFIFP